MIILLYGEDTFRLNKKLNEIIETYKAKHESGLNLIRFDSDLRLDNLKQAIEAVSMFDEKKLIVLKNILQNKILGKEFLEYIKKNKLKNNQEVIVVIFQEGKALSASIKRQANMFEEFKFLRGRELTNWAKKQITEKTGSISETALIKLAAYAGTDLWQMNNEIEKLVSYKQGKLIEDKDVDLLVNAKIGTNIFKTLDALASQDKKTALKLLHEHIEQGENEFYLFSMLVYQMRTLLKLKDLIEKGTPYYDLAKKSGLHPYVIKKSHSQLRGFSFDQLKKTYRRLLDLDLSLKTGRLDGPTALDLLVAEI